MRVGWFVAVALVAVIAVDRCAALTTTDGDYRAGHVQVAGKESVTAVVPRDNGYGTVAYSNSSMGSASSPATAKRLAFEKSKAQHPLLRVQLNLGI